MVVDLKEETTGKIVTARVGGKLTKEDYERLVPEFEEAVRRHGKIRVLVETHDFHGWDAGALWEDTKLAARHFNDIERLAIVGEKRWEKGMAVFCKPFTRAEVRYFDHAQADEAKAWIEAE